MREVYDAVWFWDRAELLTRARRARTAWLPAIDEAVCDGKRPWLDRWREWAEYVSNCDHYIDLEQDEPVGRVLFGGASYVETADGQHVVLEGP